MTPRSSSGSPPRDAALAGTAGGAPFAPVAVVPSRPLALAYRALTAGVGLWGIILVAGLFTPAPTWGAFRFYTVLSNVLCVLWALTEAWVTWRDWRSHGARGASSPSPRFSAAVMMAITVTMLIYLVVLLPSNFVQEGAYEAFTLTDTLVHVATPLLVILGWLLFTPKGHIRVFDPPLWALIPGAYLRVGFVASAAGMTFAGKPVPYPFMNWHEIGVGGVVLWIAGLFVALEAVAYLFYAVDRWLARASKLRDADPSRPGTAG